MKQLFFLVLCCVTAWTSGISVKQKNFSVPGHAPETAVEDLAGEHGIIERLLLIYEEMLHRLHANKEFDSHDLFLSADIMHRFGEQYHEIVEEDYVFPVLEANHAHDHMTAELRKQHVAGRAITKTLIQISQNPVWDKKQKHIVMKSLSEFITMYRVHISREDTDIFPTFRKLVTAQEYERLSDLFEEMEEKLFGKGAYKKFLHQIEAIEKRLDIFDIANVTPNKI